MTARGGMMREVRDDVKGARLKKEAAATTSTAMLVWQQSRRTARSGLCHAMGSDGLKKNWLEPVDWLEPEGVTSLR
jgi:hypothetical protein